MVTMTSLSNLGTGSWVINNSGVRWANGSTFDLSPRNITINAGGATFDTNGNNVTLANAFGNNGAGGLTKSGTGTLTLSGANTYTGGTTLNGGTVGFSALSNLGTGPITFNTGGLLWGSSNTADISTRVVTITGGGFSTFDTGSNSVSLANAIGNNGAGALQKKGSGTLTLNGANTYTGITFLSEGTLNVNGSIGGAGTTVASGTTLGGSGTISGGLFVYGPTDTYDAATSTKINGSGLKINGNLTIAGNTTLTGTVTSNGSFLSNDGTLVLSGSLSGSITVNNTTRVQGSVSGSVTVSNSHSLFLTGSTGDITVTGNSANFHPGADSTNPSASGIGTATDNIILNSAPKLTFYLGITTSTDNTKLAMHTVGTSISLNSANLVLKLDDAYQHIDQQKFIIFDGSGSNGVSGMFSQGTTITATSDVSPGLTDQFTILYNVDSNGQSGGKNIVLVSVPEPSSLALLGVATVISGTIRRRRFKRAFEVSNAIP